jgi:hypothetical protein
MNALFWKLLASEFKRPDANLALSILVVACGIACALASFATLSLYDSSTERPPAAKTAETSPLSGAPAGKGKKEKHSFNAVILPNPAGLRKNVSDGAANPIAVPDSSLAALKLGGARRIIPALERRIRWREENCEVILCGMDASITPSDADADKKVVMGAALADALNFSANDDFLFNGEPMRIESIRPEQGDLGDITIWTTLKKARLLLRMNGKTNALFALGCSDFESLRKSVNPLFPKAEILRFARLDGHKAPETTHTETANPRKQRSLAENPQTRRTALEKKLALFTSLAIISLAGWFFLLSQAHAKRKDSENALLFAYGARRGAAFLLELTRGVLIFIAGIPIGFILAVPSTIALSSLVDGISLQSASIPPIPNMEVEFWICFLSGAIVFSATCANALLSLDFNPLSLRARNRI